MRRRASLVTLMLLVAILGVGLAAMKIATDVVMRASFVSGFLALLIGTLGAIVRREGAWTGFGLFGWAYALALLAPPIRDVVAPLLRPEELMGEVVRVLHPEPARPAGRPPYQVLFDEVSRRYVKLSGVGLGASPVPASASEKQAWEAWEATCEAHDHWRMAADCAPRIGHVMVAVSFSCLGALAGHLFDRSLSSTGTTTGSPTTSTLG